MATKITTKHVETLTHDEAKRKNIPSAEQQSFVQQDQTAPKQIRYPRNTDLDPQLVWRDSVVAESLPYIPKNTSRNGLANMVGCRFS